MGLWVDKLRRLLPGLDPREIEEAMIVPGDFSANGGGIAILKYLPYLIVYNNLGSAITLTLTPRVAGGGPAELMVIYMGGHSNVSIPTSTYMLCVSSGVSTFVAYNYSDLPLVGMGTIVAGFGAGSSIAALGVDNSGNAFQPFQGGAAAPCSGVWHFRATLSVASTPLTVNTVLQLPDGTIASVASTATGQEYSYPVVAGVTYTVAGGTVLASSGWIGPA